MLTLRNIFDDAGDLLGYDNADFMPVAVRAQVLADIHAALQLVQSAGEDFHARETIDIETTPPTTSYLLDSTVQSVLGPVMLDRVPLSRLGSRAEYARFSAIYLDADENPATDPIAYWIECIKGVSEEAPADSVGIWLHLAPPGEDVVTLKVDVIKEPPVYTLEDLCDEDAIPPIPHQYHESILRPVVRYNVMANRRFTRPEKAEAISNDYYRALAALGLADPRRPKHPAPRKADGEPKDREPTEAAA